MTAGCLNQFDAVVGFGQTYSMLQQCTSSEQTAHVLSHVMKFLTAE